MGLFGNLFFVIFPVHFALVVVTVKLSGSGRFSRGALLF